MKRWFWLLAACLVFGGCAERNGYLAKDRALLEPKDGISIPHPVEIEKAGVKGFTVFDVPMNPDLWTEVVGGGGVWPIEGYDQAGEKAAKGYCYLSHLNWFGEFQNRCIIAKVKSELENLKFLTFNRDAFLAYRLDGREAAEISVESETDNEKEPMVYDAQKFDDDLDYRRSFLEKFGQTLDGVQIKEITVGSNEWDEYKSEVEASLPEFYKMADGQIRMGRLPLDQFRLVAVEDPGFTASSRFFYGTRIPLTLLPLLPAAYPIILGASLAGTAVVAGVDTSWKGYFARAQTLRIMMAPAFRAIVFQYQMLIKRHLNRERELENQLFGQANNNVKPSYLWGSR